MLSLADIAGRVVGISSQDVYRAYDVLWGREPGAIQLTPLREDADPRTRFFPDAVTTEKIFAEQILLGHSDLPGTVLRHPMVYGPRDGGRIADPLTCMDDGRHAILLEMRQAGWR